MFNFNFFKSDLLDRSGTYIPDRELESRKRRIREVQQQFQEHNEVLDSRLTKITILREQYEILCDEEADIEKRLQEKSFNASSNDPSFNLLKAQWEKKTRQKNEKLDEIMIEEAHLEKEEKVLVPGLTILQEEKDVEDELDKIHAHHAELAERRRRSELRRADIHNQKREQQNQEIDNIIADAIQRDIKQIKDAQRASEEARRRLREYKSKEIKGITDSLQNEEQENEKRIKAILSLKSNIEQVNKGFRENKQRAEENRRKKEKQFQAEKDSLTKDGLNPYEVFRRRELHAKRDKEQARIEQSIEDTKSRIAEETLRDRKRFAKAEQKAEEAKQFEREYMKGIGRQAQFAKTESYIQGHVKGGAGGEDGVAQYPSQYVDVTQRLKKHNLDQALVTQKIANHFADILDKKTDQESESESEDEAAEAVKSRAFVKAEDRGLWDDDQQLNTPEKLGQTRSPQKKEESKSLLSQLNNAQMRGIHQILLGELKQIGGSSVGDEFDNADLGELMEEIVRLSTGKGKETQKEQSGDQNVDGQTTTQESVCASLNPDDASQIITSLPISFASRVNIGEIAHNSLHSDTASTKTKATTMTSSTLKMNATSRPDFRTIVDPYKHLKPKPPPAKPHQTSVPPPYVSTPSTVVFKDFSVNTNSIYKADFTITNVSNQINSFKLLPLPAEASPYFDISFAPPGHVSSGISTVIHITFTPELNEDLAFSIPFSTEVGGGFSVPVRCLRKRAVITVQPSLTFSKLSAEQTKQKRDLTKKEVRDRNPKPQIISPSALTIAPVILGGVGKATLTLSNEGAIPRNFVVAGVEMVDCVNDWIEQREMKRRQADEEAEQERMRQVKASDSRGAFGSTKANRETENLRKTQLTHGTQTERSVIDALPLCSESPSLFFFPASAEPTDKKSLLHKPKKPAALEMQEELLMKKTMRGRVTGRGFGVGRGEELEGELGDQPIEEVAEEEQAEIEEEEEPDWRNQVQQEEADEQDRGEESDQHYSSENESQMGKTYLSKQQTMFTNRENSHWTSVVSVSTRFGRLSPYSKNSITFRFEPRVVGKFRALLELRFEGDGKELKEEPENPEEYDNKMKKEGLFDWRQENPDSPFFAPLPISTGSVYVLVEGSAVDCPIFLSTQILDFHTCHHDMTYKDSVIALNRGKVALQCKMEIPTSLEHFLTVTPQVGFCQAPPADGLAFKLKFKPNHTILDFLPPHFVDREQSLVEVPINVVVPDQPLPATFLFRATIASPEISFSLPAANDGTPAKRITSLNFGPCPDGTRVTTPIAVTNHSLLPQRFGFLRLPKEISVSPNFGVDLLPKETREITLTFSPLSATPFKTTLICSTDTGNEYPLTVTGSGVTLPLKTTPSAVDLGMVQWADTAKVRLELDFAETAEKKTKPETDEIGRAKPGKKPVVKKDNEDTYMFHFISPHPSLTITPTTGTITRNKPQNEPRTHGPLSTSTSCPVHISFYPSLIPELQESVNALYGIQTEASPEQDKLNETQQVSVSDDEQSLSEAEAKGTKKAKKPKTPKTPKKGAKKETAKEKEEREKKEREEEERLQREEEERLQKEEEAKREKQDEKEKDSMIGLCQAEKALFAKFLSPESFGEKPEPTILTELYTQHKELTSKVEQTPFPREFANTTHTFTIACFYIRKDEALRRKSLRIDSLSKQYSDKADEEQKERFEAPFSKPDLFGVMHITVRVTATAPLLRVMKGAQLVIPDPKADASAVPYFLMDFGCVPVGTHTQRTITLQNVFADPTASHQSSTQSSPFAHTVHASHLPSFPLTLSTNTPLSPDGPFSFGRALRPIACGGGTTDVVIDFAPINGRRTAELICLETLPLSVEQSDESELAFDENGRPIKTHPQQKKKKERQVPPKLTNGIHLKLVGTGTAPLFSVIYEGVELTNKDPSTKLQVHFGDCQVVSGKEVHTKIVTIKNDSAFSLVPQLAISDTGFSGAVKPFFLSSSSSTSATIEPGGTRPFTICFAPTQHAHFYSALLTVKVAASPTALNIPLDGEGWASPVFITGDRPDEKDKGANSAVVLSSFTRPTRISTPHAPLPSNLVLFFTADDVFDEDILKKRVEREKLPPLSLNQPKRCRVRYVTFGCPFKPTAEDLIPLDIEEAGDDAGKKGKKGKGGTEEKAADKKDAKGGKGEQCEFTISDPSQDALKAGFKWTGTKITFDSSTPAATDKADGEKGKKGKGEEAEDGGVSVSQFVQSLYIALVNTRTFCFEYSPPNPSTSPFLPGTWLSTTAQCSLKTGSFSHAMTITLKACFE
ncbi:putative Cilia- and flagella-associated protein 74 [Blattamonas nauphoetae]|uniref:Cilia- and flagella-associated protein 74 n=1 Tax=Blattamonas nauphoetae TaxID=2049346 RepID=A0ABQ9YEK3_9EUKA|nr:putative Cilia- and flagella-associated protein 74 [Blattamonas nauphoetae]